MYTPVNRARHPLSASPQRLQQDLDTLRSGTDGQGGTLLSPQQEEMLTGALGRIIHYSLRDPMAWRITNQAMASYLETGIGFDQCFDNMVQQLNDYLNE